MYKLKHFLQRKTDSLKKSEQESSSFYMSTHYLPFRRYQCEEKSDRASELMDFEVMKSASNVVDKVDVTIKDRLGLSTKDCLGCKIVSSMSLIGIFSLLSFQARKLKHPQPERTTRTISTLILAFCCVSLLRRVWTDRKPDSDKNS